MKIKWVIEVDVNKDNTTTKWKAYTKVGWFFRKNVPHPQVLDLKSFCDFLSHSIQASIEKNKPQIVPLAKKEEVKTDEQTNV